MFRIFLISILLLSNLFGVDENEIRIEANIFEANELERLSIFSGDVRIYKGRDEINSSTVKISFDKKNQPEKYEFLENVSFNIYVKDDVHYLGKADKVHLFPNTKKYIFSGAVEIIEANTGRKIEGNRVSLDGETGSARIIGDTNKPVIMSFKLNVKSEKNDKN
jgi:lipopolysaccharide export system protein LptA